MKKRAAVIVLAASLAAGCVPKPHVTREPLPRLQIVETLKTEADRLLQYYAYMSQLQNEALLREYRFVVNAYKTEPNDFNRMQLVMLLALPNAPFRNIDLAHALLGDWLEKSYNEHSKLRPLALLYDKHLSEMKRLNESTKRAKQQLRQANARLDGQIQELEAEKQKSKILQDKLDALLEMEKHLIEREQMTQPETP